MTKTCDEVFGTLIAQGLSKDELYNAVCNQVGPHMSYVSSLFSRLRNRVSYRGPLHAVLKCCAGIC